MKYSNCTLNRRDFVRAIGAATLGAGPVFALGIEQERETDSEDDLFAGGTPRRVQELCGRGLFPTADESVLGKPPSLVLPTGNAVFCGLPPVPFLLAMYDRFAYHVVHHREHSPVQRYSRVPES